MKISQKELKEIIHYDELSGEFTNLVDRRSEKGCGRVAKKGEHPGHIDKKGYRTITIYGFCYRAHHLAWLYVFGCHPSGQIDHIDGNKSNNRISNLRDCMQIENMQNLSKYKKDGYSKHIGVSYNKNNRHWVAYLISGGKRYSKQFKTEDEAINYRAELKKIHHTFNPFDREAA